MEKVDIKCVIVGDGTVGKTCMVHCYANKRFPVDYVPTVFDNQIVKLQRHNKNIFLSIWDTAGQPEFDNLRSMMYKDADVVIICYDISSRDSLESIKNKWHAELTSHVEKQPLLIMVANKTDMRENPENTDLITEEEGRAVADSIKVEKFVECSAKKQFNIAIIFDLAVDGVLAKRSEDIEPSKKCCNII